MANDETALVGVLPDDIGCLLFGHEVSFSCHNMLYFSWLTERKCGVFGWKSGGAEQIYQVVEQIYQVVEQIYQVVEQIYQVVEQIYQVVEQIYQVVEQIYQVVELPGGLVKWFCQAAESRDQVVSTAGEDFSPPGNASPGCNHVARYFHRSSECILATCRRLV